MIEDIKITFILLGVLLISGCTIIDDRKSLQNDLYNCNQVLEAFAEEIKECNL